MNFPQQPPPYSPPQKQGPSTTKIVLLVGGGLLVVLLGTCGVAAFRGYSAYREVVTELSEGGIPDASPADVIADLAGPKKDYVGEWTSPSGKSTLHVAANGEVDFHGHEKTMDEHVEGPIAGFTGNDMDFKLGIRFTLKVKTPPHFVGGNMEMVVNDITFERPATP